MIPVVVQVPTVNGRPDLQLPAGVEVTREGDVFHVSWGGDEVATLRLLGRPSGQDPVLVGMLSRRAARRLDHLGARVERLHAAWRRPALKSWLQTRGVVEDESGFPIVPHVIAGSPSVGDDGTSDD